MTHDEDDVEALSETVSFKLSAALNDEIEATLDSPHTKSEWIREACRQHLDETTPAVPNAE